MLRREITFKETQDRRQGLESPMNMTENYIYNPVESAHISQSHVVWCTQKLPNNTVQTTQVK